MGEDGREMNEHEERKCGLIYPPRAVARMARGLKVAKRRALNGKKLATHKYKEGIDGWRG